MSIRHRADRGWVVEEYDPATKKKRQLTHREIAALGFDTPRSERQARRVDAAAIQARSSARPGAGDESCESFATRWPDDFTRRRGASTREHNRERVRAFGREHADRMLRAITREDALRWLERHPATLPALRAMFSDAVNVKLADDNPFAKLGIEQPKGREDITVLTLPEVSALAELAVDVHGPVWGPEMAALVIWSAYTCVRPGESFAARYGLLDGDVYHLQAQFNSTLGEETPPKHGGVGTIYVPEPARRAVLEKPRRIGDDLIFRGKRGQQLRQESLSRAWGPVRAAFMATLGPGHHLHQRLALDPKDRLDFYELRHFGASYMLNALEIEPWVIAKQLRHSDDGQLVVKLYGHPTRESAIDRIRRAYGANVRPIVETSGAAQGQAFRDTAS